MKQKIALKHKKPRKQINENLMIWVVLMESNKVQLINFFYSQKLKARISFIQLKPVLGIFLHGLSLPVYPQNSLKVLLL
jgi:hypothetical protein